MRGYLSLVIHYWIGDVQDFQGVSASEITYIVSDGALNSAHSLTDLQQLIKKEPTLQLWLPGVPVWLDGPGFLAICPFTYGAQTRQALVRFLVLSAANCTTTNHLYVLYKRSIKGGPVCFKIPQVNCLRHSLLAFTGLISLTCGSKLYLVTPTTITTDLSKLCFLAWDSNQGWPPAGRSWCGCVYAI